MILYFVVLLHENILVNDDAFGYGLHLIIIDNLWLPGSQKNDIMQFFEYYVLFLWCSTPFFFFFGFFSMKRYIVPFLHAFLPVTDCYWFLQVLGNAKGAVAVVVSILIFRNPVSVTGMLGYTLTVFGVILYSEAKKRSRKDWCWKASSTNSINFALWWEVQVWNARWIASLQLYLGFWPQI